MNRPIPPRALPGWLAAAALSASAGAWAAGGERTQDPPDPREFTYLQLAAGSALSTRGDVNVGLGSGVQLAGRAGYERGPVWGLTLGRQFLREEDRQAARAPQTPQTPQAQQPPAAGATASASAPPPEPPRPLRVELELWQASLTRHTVEVGVQKVHPDDKVKPRAVFVNLAIPVAQSDEHYAREDKRQPTEPLWRTWLGAGLGYASQSYPAASAIASCNCLRQASGSGLAFQLKLQAERQFGDNTYLFGQIGRVWLPAVSTTEGAQRTDYARWGVNQVVVGVRWKMSN